MEVAFKVPTELSEIRLSDYQKFISIVENEDNDLFVRQKMVQIFCDVPLLAVSRMKRKDFISISNSLTETLQSKNDLIPTISINGQEFGFVPNLDKIQLGEFTDLDKYLSNWSDFHKAMAVLYRPITSKIKNKYLIEEYQGSDKYSSLMKGITMDVVMGAVLFFWTLSRQLLTIIPKYLEQLAKGQKEALMDLEKNGGGINTFISSLEETCSKLMKLSGYQLGRL